MKDDAVAWAVRTALALPVRETWAAQAVCWHCAEPFAEELLSGGEAACTRLGRFWIAPLRSQTVEPVSLPKRGPEAGPPAAAG
jgi:hypothetical protein